MKKLLCLYAIALFGLASLAWAGGAHLHIPRGTGGAAYEDTVQVDAGDHLIAASAAIDSLKGNTLITTATIDSVDTRVLTADSLTAITHVTAGTFYGDGSNLTGVGSAAATAITITARAAVDITKGQVVYISGATGGFPDVSLADARAKVASAPVGVAAESKLTGQQIAIRVAGNLSGLNTSGFADGAALWLTGAGGYDDEYPTAGEIWRIAHVAYSHVSAGELLIGIGTTHNTGAAAGDTITIRMGDAAGLTSISYLDSNNVTVGYINSDGQAVFSGGLDNTVVGATTPKNVHGDSIFVGGNVQIGGTAGHGADNAIIMTQGTAPTETITDGIALWVEDDVTAELHYRDEADNVGTLTANVSSYPAQMAVDSRYPYVKMYGNLRIGIRTYLAERRAYKILQAMAHRGGYLHPDSLIIYDEFIPVSLPAWETLLNTR